MKECAYHFGFVESGFTKCTIHCDDRDFTYHVNVHIAGENNYHFSMKKIDIMWVLCIHDFFQMRFSWDPTKMLVKDKGKKLNKIMTMVLLTIQHLK